MPLAYVLVCRQTSHQNHQQAYRLACCLDDHPAACPILRQLARGHRPSRSLADLIVAPVNLTHLICPCVETCDGQLHQIRPRRHARQDATYDVF